MLTPAPLVNEKNLTTEGNIFPTKRFEVEKDNNKYKLEVYIEDYYLCIKCIPYGLYPMEIFSNKLSDQDLGELCKKLFLDENIEICFSILIELMDNKEYVIEKEENVINLIFKPSLKIQEFKISLYLNKLNQNEINQAIYEKINELIKENELLKAKLNKKENNILLISNKSNETFANLLNLHDSINKISILSPKFILPKLTEKNIKQFKIIIYDLQDAGYGDTTNKKDIYNYLNNGGNIILTHDQWSYLKNKGLIELIGAKLIQQNYVYANKAKIIKNLHPIFNSYYNLQYSKDSFVKVQTTHKTDTVFENSEEYNNNIIMELDDGKRGEYLLVKNIGKGKIIFWNVGHSPNLNDFEEKLFINILSWILN